VPQNISAGDTIFVCSESLNEFFYKIHPQIKNPYILITLYLGTIPCIDDPKIIAWFGNCYTEESTPQKFAPIPLGVLRYEKYFMIEKKLMNFFSDSVKSQSKNFFI
jgi:hypothetical protein